MEFKNPAQLRRIADVSTTAPKTMTRRERLDRWAELLARNPGRVLKTLEEIEFRPSRERAAMRADNSPLSVAYADPVLREEGLRSDRLGDATAFFGISEHQAHRVVCSCLNGRTIESGRAAQKVRAIARGTHEMLAGAAIAAMIGAPLFLYFF
jgi:hypothetical protein